MKKHNVSIVIPCFNEETRVPNTISNVLLYCLDNFNKFEIILVDDGSSDNTSKVVEKLFFMHGNVRQISYEHNMGKGYAVKVGVEAAKYKIILFMDADNATRLDMMPRFIPYLYNHDMLVASRNLPQSNIVIKQTLKRIVMGRVFALLVRIIIRTKIRDTQCGFKIFCTKKAKDLFKIQSCNRFAFDVELIMNAEKQNLKIKEIPIDWYDDINTKVGGTSENSAFKMLKDVMKIWNLKRN